MKVIKESDQSILLNAFGLKDRYYLSISVLVCFDLLNPELLVSEKEMWKCVKTQLGKGKVLDQGMAKETGEVLVAGACCAPEGKPRPAAQISFRVGGLRKKLDVFGNRFWKKAGAIHTITDPEPFVSIPVDYEHAFGGAQFLENPMGKGMTTVINRDGDEVIPMPNIEDPDHIIGGIDDRPHPAGFGPYELTWPQRANKTGTYDEKWLKEKWPFFPDDINLRFFNAAPEDQWIPEYFKGDEDLEIMNMHPREQLISSRLPAVRQRLFITSGSSLKKEQGNEEFREIKTRLDTVWLFPGDLKGVVIFRGVAETVDDEYSDIVRVFPVSEKMDDQPLPIEHYLEEQKKRIQRKIDVDKTPIEEAKKKIAISLERIKEIPLKIEEAKARAFGQEPPPPSAPPAQKIISLKRKLDQAKENLKKTEARAAAMKAKYGHMVKIDTTAIEKTRRKIAEIEARLPQIQSSVESDLAEAEENKGYMAAVLKGEGGALAEDGVIIDPDWPVLGLPDTRWHERGMHFVSRSLHNLLEDSQQMGTIGDFGLNRKTVKKFLVGYNPQLQQEKAVAWGAAEAGQGVPEQDMLELPPGYIIPIFDQARLVKIICRPDNLLNPSKDTVIKGSVDTPMILGSLDAALLVICMGEVDGLLVRQEAGSLCSVVVLRTPDQKMPDDLKAVLDERPYLPMAWNAGDVDPDSSEWKKWGDVFPNAFRLNLPEGDTPVQAFKAGHDLAGWIREALKDLPDVDLPPEEEKASPEDIKPGAMVFPKLDIKGMMDGYKKDARALAAGAKDEAAAEQKAAMAQAKDAVKDLGLDPEDIMNPAKHADDADPLDPSALLSALSGERKRLSEMNQLTPDLDKKIKDAEELAGKMSAYGSSRQQEADAKIAAAKTRAENPIPPNAKAKMKKLGLDPETGKKLESADVAALAGKGESLSGMNLSGMDLSKMDLQGVDFSKANCLKTVFAGADLTGADFTGALCTQADFSEAILSGACLEKGVFHKAVLAKSDLKQANMRRAMLVEADLTGADLTGAVLEFAVLEKASFTGAVLTDIRARRSFFRKNDASDADFKNADLTKAAFFEVNLDNADFSNSTSRSTVFSGVAGKNVNFSNSEMENCRIMKSASLSGAVFNGASFTTASFMDSDLSGADFRSSRFHKAVLQGCNLREADLHKVSAVNTRFTKSDLSGADMRGINLFGGSLRKSRLTGTDLRYSNLFGVDFFKAVLGETKLHMANMKRTQLEEAGDLLK